MADKTHQLRYNILVAKELSFIVFACTNFIIFTNRQTRGEELDGLNLEELQKLEKMLEAGLTRVLETKVFVGLLVSILYITITCQI